MLKKTKFSIILPFLTVLSTGHTLASTINYDFNSPDSLDGWSSSRSNNYVGGGLFGRYVVRAEPYKGAILINGKDGSAITTSNQKGSRYVGVMRYDASSFSYANINPNDLYGGIKDTIVLDIYAPKAMSSIGVTVNTDNKAYIKYSDIKNDIDLGSGWRRLTLGVKETGVLTEIPSTELSVSVNYGAFRDLRDSSTRTALDKISNEGAVIYVHGYDNAHVETEEGNFVVYKGGATEFDGLWNSDNNSTETTSAQNALNILASSIALNELDAVGLQRQTALTGSLDSLRDFTRFQIGFNAGADAALDSISTVLAAQLSGGGVKDPSTLINVFENFTASVSSSALSPEWAAYSMGEAQYKRTNELLTELNESLENISQLKASNKTVPLSLIQQARGLWEEAGVSAIKSGQYFLYSTGNTSPDDGVLINFAKGLVQTGFEQALNVITNLAVINEVAVFAEITNDSYAFAKGFEDVIDSEIAQNEQFRVSGRSVNPFEVIKGSAGTQTLLKQALESKLVSEDIYGEYINNLEERAIELLSAKADFGSPTMGEIKQVEGLYGAIDAIELVNASPAWVDLSIDTLDNPFAISFDYQLSDMSQYLEVWLNGIKLDEFFANEFTLGTWIQGIVMVDDHSLLSLLAADLQFYTMGDTGSTTLITGVKLTELVDREHLLALNQNLSPVPVPAAAWLFGSALLGFAGFSRRRKNKAA